MFYIIVHQPVLQMRTPMITQSGQIFFIFLYYAMMSPRASKILIKEFQSIWIDPQYVHTLVSLRGGY